VHDPLGARRRRRSAVIWLLGLLGINSGASSDAAAAIPFGAGTGLREEIHLLFRPMT